ncbi:MAG TPA: hypothetical protein VK787_04010 [Puia sp.]|jgi:hypothetical protein|nr:hypothetical protein [Puia sp.]
MKKYSLSVAAFFIFLLNCFGQSNLASQEIQDIFQDYSSAQTTARYTGSFLPQFNPKEDTKGHRYLFNKWVNGFVTDTANNVFNKTTYLFNYDKIGKSLLCTQDKNIVYEFSSSTIKSFVLQSDSGQYIFERISSLNNGNFIQQIVKGEKYSLYKSIKTTFIKSDYYSDGLIERGNRYDEYVDESTYYILLPGGKDCGKIEFKKKSIKAALPLESVKVNKYFSDHSDEDIDENFIKGLLTFLNQ